MTKAVELGIIRGRQHEPKLLGSRAKSSAIHRCHRPQAANPDNDTREQVVPNTSRSDVFRIPPPLQPHKDQTSKRPVQETNENQTRYGPKAPTGRGKRRELLNERDNDKNDHPTWQVIAQVFLERLSSTGDCRIHGLEHPRLSAAILVLARVAVTFRPLPCPIPAELSVTLAASPLAINLRKSERAFRLTCHESFDVK
jgi:hypothetical protein